jgi:hypothetical protein
MKGLMSAISSALSTPAPHQVSPDLRKEKPLPQGLEQTIEHGKQDIKAIPKKYEMDFANTNLFNDITDEDFMKIRSTAIRMYRAGDDLAQIHECINNQIAFLKEKRENAAHRYLQQRLEDTQKAASFANRLSCEDFDPKLRKMGKSPVTATHQKSPAGLTGKAFESTKRAREAQEDVCRVLNKVEAWSKEKSRPANPSQKNPSKEDRYPKHDSSKVHKTRDN